MTDVLIARHGQSEWNAVGRWLGQADPPLSPLGRLQAAHAASRLDGIEVIVASDLERAHQTALIIAEQLDHPEVLVEADFRERHAGEWQGLTKAEIEAEWPGYLAERRRPPGFESDDVLLERTGGALDRVLAAHADARVLVVSHGGVIYRLEEHLGEDAVVRIPNLGGRWFGHDGSTLALGERILLVEPDEVTVPSQL
jgi:probable phosphoglycerate mutase